MRQWVSLLEGQDVLLYNIVQIAAGGKTCLKQKRGITYAYILSGGL